MIGTSTDKLGHGTETPHWIGPVPGAPGPLSVLGAAAALLVVLACPALTAAQDAASSSDACATLRAATANLSAEPTAHTLNGVAGLWFPSPIARLMLCEVRELRVRRREVTLHAAELRLWEQRVDFTERQRELAVEARDRLEDVVEAAARRAREAESELGAWYRHPALWFAVGAVVSGALLIAGAAAAGGGI